MFQAFANDADGGDRPSVPAPLPRFSDDSESLRVLLIGSSATVTAAIHNLHGRRFAEVGAWSPFIPWGENEVMSMLTKRWRRGSNE